MARLGCNVCEGLHLRRECPRTVGSREELVVRCSEVESLNKMDR